MRESINVEERVRFLKNQKELKYFSKPARDTRTQMTHWGEIE